MNPDKMGLSSQIALVMKVTEQRTLSFMQTEMGLTARKVTRRLDRNEPVSLRAITAIVGIGSGDGVFIAYSYDESLIRLMTSRFTAELSVQPDEEALYMRETASEVVNIIVGNSTADLARRGQTVNLSPPMLAIGARIIQGRPGTANAVLNLDFDQGAMDIAFVGPKLLFDEYLNYKEEVA